MHGATIKIGWCMFNQNYSFGGKMRIFKMSINLPTVIIIIIISSSSTITANDVGHVSTSIIYNNKKI